MVAFAPATRPPPTLAKGNGAPSSIQIHSSLTHRLQRVLHVPHSVNRLDVSSGRYECNNTDRWLSAKRAASGGPSLARKCGRTHITTILFFPARILAKNCCDLSAVARTTWITLNNPSKLLPKYGHRTIRSRPSSREPTFSLTQSSASEADRRKPGRRPP